MVNGESTSASKVLLYSPTLNRFSVVRSNLTKYRLESILIKKNASSARQNGFFNIFAGCPRFDSMTKAVLKVQKRKVEIKKIKSRMSTMPLEEDSICKGNEIALKTRATATGQLLFFAMLFPQKQRDKTNMEKKKATAVFSKKQAIIQDRAHTEKTNKISPP